MTFFLDSNVLIEAFKKDGIKEAQNILTFIVKKLEAVEININSIVFSETV